MVRNLNGSSFYIKKNEKPVFILIQECFSKYCHFSEFHRWNQLSLVLSLALSDFPSGKWTSGSIIIHHFLWAVTFVGFLIAEHQRSHGFQLLKNVSQNAFTILQVNFKSQNKLSVHGKLILISLTCSSDTFNVFLNTIQVTLSSKGGVVRDPS